VSLPDEDRVSKAVDYLVKTDEPWARACAALEAAEMTVKQEREIAFLEADGTQAERAAKANSSGRVKLAAKAVEAAVFEKEMLKARRSTALVVIDVWRSLNSNRRAGIA
jgi:hypothetical protein